MDLQNFWWFTGDDGEICLGTEPSTLASTVIATSHYVQDDYSFQRKILDKEAADIEQLRAEMVKQEGYDEDETLPAAVGAAALDIFEAFMSADMVRVLEELREQFGDDDE